MWDWTKCKQRPAGFRLQVVQFTLANLARANMEVQHWKSDNTVTTKENLGLWPNHLPYHNMINQLQTWIISKTDIKLQMFQLSKEPQPSVLTCVASDCSDQPGLSLMVPSFYVESMASNLSSLLKYFPKSRNGMWSWDTHAWKIQHQCITAMVTVTVTDNFLKWK